MKGRYEVARDEKGRFFIDRDPTIFKHVLEFMRSDILPPPEMFLKVYEEAQYLSFDALIGTEIKVELFSKFQQEKKTLIGQR